MAEKRSIIVVGGGIVGASIAWHLAKAGTPPLVIMADGEGPATSGSFAWINASHGNPEPYFRLRAASIADWRRIGGTELPAMPVRLGGSLTFDMPAHEVDGYVHQYRDWGYAIEAIGPAEIRAREPRLRQVPDRAALCLDEGAVEPVAAARLFLEAAEAQGARIMSGIAVEGLITEGGRVTGVASRIGQHRGDLVVLAAGIGNPRLAADAGVTLPMRTPEGLLVNTQPLPKVLNGLLVAPDLHVRQTLDGRLVAGLDFVGSIIESRSRTEEVLLERVRDLIDLPEPIELERTTVAQRPTPSDGFPAVGAAPGTEGLYIASTHSGVTLAPAIGRMAAEEILTGQRDPLLEPYDPGRF
ncbi:MAG: FAD-dependent oxidoreductase [Hyphomicrobiaceae bacterium]